MKTNFKYMYLKKESKAEDVTTIHVAGQYKCKTNR